MVVNTINFDMIVITGLSSVHRCEKLNYIHVVLMGHMDRHDNI